MSPATSIGYGAIITAAVLIMLAYGTAGIAFCVIAWFIWVVVDALVML